MHHKSFSGNKHCVLGNDNDIPSSADMQDWTARLVATSGTLKDT